MAEAFNPYHRWLGIPPAEQPANHYRLLGIVLYESDPDVIESAADRQMAHVRTFQSGRYSEQSQTVLNELAAAKTCLLKPQRKAEYDQQLRARLQPSPTPSPMPHIPTAIPVPIAAPVPMAETIPLASQPNFVPQAPQRIPQLSPTPRSSSAAPASRTPRKSKGNNTALLAGIGASVLLFVCIVGWQLSRRPPQELAAKPDAPSTSMNRTTESSVKTPAVSTPSKPTVKNPVVSPVDVKPAPVQPVVPQPPKVIASVTAKTGSAMVPPLGANIVLTPGPNAVIPREIKFTKPGGATGIFTPDNSHLLYFSRNQIEIWNLAEEKLTGSTNTSYSQFAVSPDGKKLAAEIAPSSGQGLGMTIAIIDLVTRQELHRLTRPADELKTGPLFHVLGFDRTSSKLFTSSDVDLQVWDVNTGALLRRIGTDKPPGNFSPVYSLEGRYITVHAPFASILDTETETVTRINLKAHELGTIFASPPTSLALASWSLNADGTALYGVDQINGALLQWSLPDVKYTFGVAVPDLLFAKISPDNTRLALTLKTSKDTVHVLDRASMQAIATLKSSDSMLASYSISSDGRWVFLRGPNQASLFDLGPQTAAKIQPTPQPVVPPQVASVPAKQPNDPTSSVTTVTASMTPAPGAIAPREVKLPDFDGSTPTFTPDSARLFCGKSDRIDIWNLAEEKLAGSIVGIYSSFLISPDGKKLAAETRSNSIKIVDLATQKELCELSRPPDEFKKAPWFRLVGFDSASNKLFTRTNVDVQVWDVNAGKMLGRIQDKNPPSNNATAHSLNGQRLFIDYPFTPNVIDTQTETLIPIKFGARDLEKLVTGRLSWSLSTWSFSADGKSAFSTETNNGLFLEWSLPEAKLSSSVAIPDLGAAKISPDGRRILAQQKSAGNILYVFDRASLQVIASLPTTENRLASVAISPDSRWLVLRDKSGIRLYDFSKPSTDPPAKVASLPAAPATVQPVLAAPVTAPMTPSPKAMVPREIKLSKRGGNSSSFTPDGALLLYAGNNQINIWNLAEEKQTGTIASARLQLAVSPDGKKLAFEAVPPPSNNSDPVIKIVNLADLQELHQLTRPPGETTSPPFFRVCGFDGKANKLFTRTKVDVQVWDAQTGTLLRRMTPDKPHQNALATYSLNGQKTVVTYMFFSSVIDTETEVATRINADSRDLERFLGKRPSTWSVGSWSLAGDGQTIYGIEAVSGLLLEWSLPDAKLVSGVIIPDLVSAKVSPDGTRVLAESKSARNTVHVLDRFTMQIIATLIAPGDRILHCSISPDNRWVFLSGAEENRLYDFGPQPAKN